MWEKEEKIINGLGKLYPIFEDRVGYRVLYKNHFGNLWKAWWVYWLTVQYLDQRIPSLEHYLRIHNHIMWIRYADHFGI